MRLPSTKFILFNAAAVIVAAAALFTAVRSMFATSVTPPCSERYLKMTAFALERGGVMLTSSDLQAMSGGRDAGVIENVSIVRKEGPAPLAMEVRLQKGSAGGEDGMSFPWEPRVLAGKTSACLSYQAFLPNDFDFRRGGRLPGLASGADQPHAFATAVAWSINGRAGATLRTAPGAGTLIPAQADVTLAKSRWLRFDQEVVLNTPKAADGILRIWIDGALVIERKDVAYRQADEVSLAAVVADAHYTGPAFASDKAAKIWLSPLEVRWQ